ncbi:hypothetical protein [Amycolatopsis sp. H20-H5]|uniref:hypothetical protein n=1 Tax=Amycolatopsis sp. H20-H5 TaxID=3046309 RepID=UPI002DB90BC5|nr:hypothetical protein [Amycolatopsis sp. H20-H5]MEC3979909.1 hypothetical protein [Amycolatopsis sp. H20-H5]
MSHTTKTTTTDTRPLHLVSTTTDATGPQPATIDTKVRDALLANPGATTATLAMEAGVGRSTAAKLLARWAKEGTVIRANGTDPASPATWTIDVADACADDGDAISATEPNTVTTSPGIPDTSSDTADDSTGTHDHAANAAPANTTAAPSDDDTASADAVSSAPALNEPVDTVDTATEAPSVDRDGDAATRNDTNPGQAAAADSGDTGSADAEPHTGDPDADQDARPSAPTPSPTVQGSPTDRLPKGGLYELVKTYLAEHPTDSFGPAKIGTELTRSGGAVNNALEKLVIDGHAIKTCEAPKRFAYNTAN